MNNTITKKYPQFFDIIKNDPNFEIVYEVRNSKVFDELYPKEFLLNFWKEKKYKFTTFDILNDQFLDLVSEIDDNLFGVIVNDTLSGIIIKSKKEILNFIKIIKNEYGNEDFGITSICGLNTKQMIYISHQGEVSTNF